MRFYRFMFWLFTKPAHSMKRNFLDAICMKKSVLILLLFSSAQFSVAQSSEAGIMLGVSSYKGDLSGSLFNTNFLNLAFGGHFRHYYNNHWALKLGVNYGTISADDAESNDPFQLYRNLSFRSRVLEMEGQFEFSFFPYQTANDRTLGSPYLFIGLAVYKFNPKALLNDDWIELQPLGTEGQGTTAYPDRKQYKKVQLSIPFGGGYKFRLSDRFGLALEVGARRTFTDYLDDVSTTYARKDVLAASYGGIAVALSDRTVDQVNENNNDRQRGDAAHKDYYMFTGVSLNYTLSKKYNDNCRSFQRKLH